MTLKFGTDGWRAEIAKEFTFENVERMAQAYADVLKSNVGAIHELPLQPIPIGYDRRFLSPDFAKAFAAVMIANGFKMSLSSHYCPTPCISWIAKETKAPGGVMITASHNPFQWNGVKFKESYGGSAAPAFTKIVEDKIDENDRAGKKPQKISIDEISKSPLYSEFSTEKYIGQLRSQIDLKLIQQSKWKIAHDPLFGAGSGYLTKILEQPITELHGETNPSFGGLNPEPIEKNLRDFMTLVKTQSFDVGLATDGDADRIGAVDEEGNFISPQQIFALLLKHLAEKGLRGDVVKTVSTTHMVDILAKKYNLPVHELPIGFKHICGKFLETNPLIGGEESGGIGIPSHVYERDGLLSGLLLVEMMSVKKKRLGDILKDLTNEIGPFHFIRDDVHFAESELLRVKEKITTLQPSTLAGQKVARVNRMDGIKIYLEDNSWLLMRLSGTEPLLRIYAEASTLQQSRAMIQNGREFLGI